MLYFQSSYLYCCDYHQIDEANTFPGLAIRSHNDVGSFRPKVGDLQILSTAKGSITLGAVVNFTNPTEYTATVPYVDIHIGVNGTLLGHATAENVKVVPGENVGLPVTAVWFPAEYGGEEGPVVGKELLSQYISGECVPYHERQ